MKFTHLSNNQVKALKSSQIMRGDNGFPDNILLLIIWKSVAKMFFRVKVTSIF